MSTTSGTYNFSLSNADIVLEAFDRCEVRPVAITAEHMISARRSLNLELQKWGNKGVNLWCVDTQTVPLVPGVATYSVPSNTISILDVYLRTFSLTTAYNFTPNFSTVSGSTNITCVISNHGLTAGGFINVKTQVSVGGLILYGFYLITSVPDQNTFTFAAISAATSTVNNGGSIPLFTATAGQIAINVTLANHGQVAGNLFYVGVQTIVGGVTLFGAYQVTGATDANNFGIALNQTVVTSQVLSENGGFAQVLGQAASTNQTQPTDRIMVPMGRTDYAQLPNKFMQGTPNQYWFDRLINPTITLWQVPDSNGPYELVYYRMRQIQDASPTMGQIAEIPYRFIDAFAAGLAERLGVKYAKQMLPVLSQYAQKAWEEAAIEDRERADIYITPNVAPYYRST